MAVGALVLYAVFGALGFGWRSWQQRRHTGSSGFRGVSGRPGSVEWCAGVGFVVAILVGLAALALQALAVLDPIPPLHHPLVQAAGTVMAIGGICATLYAQHDMGDSWRIGVDHTETTVLVRRGVFAVIRNPIFTAMLCFAAGITLMAPNVLAVLGFAVLLASIEMQVRVVEEPYLLATHGEEYRDYLSTVGRFLPGIGQRGV